MPEFVINVYPNKKGGVRALRAVVVRTPVTVADNAEATADFEVAVDKEPFVSLMKRPFRDGGVRECGDQLFKSLEQVERFKQVQLDKALRTPIFFQLQSAVSENLPWEALWHREAGFVALEPNWPIARLPPAPFQHERALAIEPELKILLVLAAAVGTDAEPVDATDEWNAISSALRQLPDSRRVRMHVMACQDSIIDAAEALASPKLRVTAEPIASAQALDRAIEELGPNIVHFFCHGNLDAAEPRLVLATRGDYEGEEPHGSLSIGLSKLAPLHTNDNVWLVALNCCEGGHALEQTGSLAAKLANLGVPAVVAMRESVNFRKASAFAGEFYSLLLGKLVDSLPSDAAAQAGASVALDASVWVDSMQHARSLLAQLPQAYHDPGWTLPMVYVPEKPLQLKARPRAASLMTMLPTAVRDKIISARAELRTTQAFVNTLRREDAPMAIQNEMLARLAKLERAADVSERQALLDHLQAGDPSDLKVAMVKERIVELDARLA
jgi:hypothetical protein